MTNLSSSPTAGHFGLLHEIFVLDAHLVKALDCSRAKTITRNLVDALLTALRMEELGELQIYPAVDNRAPGWSFIQPITTSHISGHYFEKPGRNPHIRMDFYSCCTVNWMKIIEILNTHLGLADWRGTFIDRQIERDSTRHILDIAGEGERITYEAVMKPRDALTIATEAKKKEVAKMAS
ncbi:hypothetical protein COU78_02045 [Candidatus Peregrinibacteria bacterium CG10_big_fil_rev_8_21_14_0_10_49_24]|nr:MAG: hypothetical protein COV83_03645 [Candidatus Peregrinibacteria bacterium CG11_big_fil_rev_8_21_14_0_20_49_14]PIR51260.1 MAG: hypothetical protein COU78_02045 [Candidatus Peregrinibacteria bacterium CG10_big_fil_rev_8_21_14_0_10_49_24]PJA68068.1 MAG: hypothetical protein CO157_00810 [Candidatus Peregrinibacteria bacterium CG_4_9_14_3_um_filter_49_12]